MLSAQGLSEGGERDFVPMIDVIGEGTDLLGQLVRDACVDDGPPTSGGESRRVGDRGSSLEREGADGVDDGSGEPTARPSPGGERVIPDVVTALASWLRRRTS